MARLPEGGASHSYVATDKVEKAKHESIHLCSFLTCRFCQVKCDVCTKGQHCPLCLADLDSKGPPLYVFA